MSYSTFATLRFERELKRLVKKFPSLKEEYSEVVQNLNGNSKTGTFVGKSCYKIRLV